ncbi:pyridoxamine 5'-phosphate oxidase family protein [Ottowia sp.]|uniref:pyridoxamine 5'-phosphate oxidase family protein n=1 Tax=Ottowia sp. TaxID=1898956 RepID=UPI003A898CEE
MPSTHLPRLGHALCELLCTRRVAALSTLDVASGGPFVSMVPFAVDGAQRCIVLHLSALAAHTTNLNADARAALLVTAPEPETGAVHDLHRVTLMGRASTPEPDSALARSARTAYLARFPEAAPMTGLLDFHFVTLRLTEARQVAGFGTARHVGADELSVVLSAAHAGA